MRIAPPTEQQFQQMPRVMAQKIHGGKFLPQPARKSTAVRMAQHRVVQRKIGGQVKDWSGEIAP